MANKQSLIIERLESRLESITRDNRDLQKQVYDLENELDSVKKYVPDSDYMQGDCFTCKFDDQEMPMPECNNCKCNFGIKNNYVRKV